MIHDCFFDQINLNFSFRWELVKFIRKKKVNFGAKNDHPKQQFLAVIIQMVHIHRSYMIGLGRLVPIQ